VFYQSE